MKGILICLVVMGLLLGLVGSATAAPYTTTVVQVPFHPSEYKGVCFAAPWNNWDEYVMWYGSTGTANHRWQSPAKRLFQVVVTQDHQACWLRVTQISYRGRGR